MSVRILPLFSRNIITKFWTKISIPLLPSRDSCWIWIGSTDEDGYGKFSPFENSKSLGCFRAHRIVYSLCYADDPAEFMVLHHCDNPPCCNPLHLYKGTSDNNIRDMVERNRHAFGSRSPRTNLTEAQVREIKLALASARPRDTALRRKLAKENNVTMYAINNIYFKKNSWKHVSISC